MAFSTLPAMHECITEFTKKVMKIKDYQLAWPQLTFDQATECYKNCIDIEQFDMKKHLQALRRLRKTRINPTDLLLRDWDEMIFPMICTNNHWYHSSELEKVDLCPYTREPIYKLKVVWSLFFQSAEIPNQNVRL